MRGKRVKRIDEPAPSHAEGLTMNGASLTKIDRYQALL
jgi:hypothetical protein